MRVVVAPDSFGGTLTAVQAAAALAQGWRSAVPTDDVVEVPVSDGGPGFVAVLASVLGGELVELTVEGPDAAPAPAAFLRVGDTAYVESAAACGLHLLTAPDPLGATTYGVGQLIAAALRSGVRRVVVGLGGSATTDGGAGALAALGVGRFGADGAQLAPGGGALSGLAELRGAPLPELDGVELVVASDVDNPLLGLTGAAAVYGPQKGADASQVQVLDHAVGVWASALTDHLSLDPALVRAPGAGAAGGLGFGLMALGARRVAGIATVLDVLGLASTLDTADLVVTGEGSFDWQSLRGKAASGVAALAAERGLVCLVLAGQVSVGRREASAAGIEATYSVAEHLGSVDAAMTAAGDGLSALAARVAGQWSR